MDSSQPSQLAQYIPILFLFAAAAGFAGGTLLVSVLLGKFAKSNKAKDAAVKEGIHSLQIGVQSYAVDHNDTYPTGILTSAALVDSGGKPYVDNWPKNPFTTSPMVDGTAQGNYTYSIPASNTFRLIGHTSNGVDFTVP